MTSQKLELRQLYVPLLIDEAHIDPNTKNPDKGTLNPKFLNIMSLNEVAVNKEGKTAMDIAVEKRHNEIVMILVGKSVCRKLANGFRKALETALYSMCHPQIVFTTTS